MTAGYTTGGYITVLCGDHTVLVETGTPVTLARMATPFEFGNTLVRPVVPPFDFDEASRMGGVSFDVLLGNDVLQRQSFTITREGVHFEVLPIRNSPRTLVLPFERRPGGLVGRVNLGGAEIEAIIDTGAALISLAPAAWLDVHGGEPVGDRREFYRSMEGWVEYDTPLYHVPVQVGDQVRTLTMGRVPEASAVVMRAGTGTSFVVGTYLLLQCEMLTYDAARRTFTLNGGLAATMLPNPWFL